MLAAILNWLSPTRRRFMRRIGRPALARMSARLQAAGSPRAVGFFSTLLDANIEFLAFALSPQGPFSAYARNASPETVEATLGAMLIFSVNLFARDELANNESELIPLLAAVTQMPPMQVMVRRDNLRKAPRSEEWMLYGWIVATLGGEKPAYDGELERRFGYNYLAYIGQYRSIVEREVARPEP
ncbi:MAG: hypothetical protein ACLQAT_31830 [Candidatus Binataceae bacterium]